MLNIALVISGIFRDRLTPISAQSLTEIRKPWLLTSAFALVDVERRAGDGNAVIGIDWLRRRSAFVSSKINIDRRLGGQGPE